MNDQAEQVWQSMSQVLKHKRQQRQAIRATALGALTLTALTFLWPRSDPPPGAPQVAVPESVELADPEPATLAVLVYDGVGMRFELFDAMDLASSDWEFSLQPVFRDRSISSLW